MCSSAPRFSEIEYFPFLSVCIGLKCNFSQSGTAQAQSPERTRCSRWTPSSTRPEAMLDYCRSSHVERKKSSRVHFDIRVMTHEAVTFSALCHKPARLWCNITGAPSTPQLERLNATYHESMATTGCPSHTYPVVCSRWIVSHCTAGSASRHEELGHRSICQHTDLQGFLAGRDRKWCVCSRSVAQRPIYEAELVHAVLCHFHCNVHMTSNSDPSAPSVSAIAPAAWSTVKSCSWPGICLHTQKVRLGMRADCTRSQ